MLVGSMAMAAQGVVRATRDVDVFVDPSIDTITAADLAGEYPAIQYAPPEADYWIDLLARLGHAVRYSDVESEILRVDDVSIRVATPRMLYRLKKDSVRPQDRVDAQVLKERFGLEDD